MLSSQDCLNERYSLKEPTRPPSLYIPTPPPLSVSVLLDSDVSRSPGLAAVSGDQAARGTVEPDGVRVVWVRGVHDQCRVEVVMLWDGSAFRLLALHRCCERMVSTSALHENARANSTDLCPKLRHGRLL